MSKNTMRQILLQPPSAHKIVSLAFKDMHISEKHVVSKWVNNFLKTGIKFEV